MSKSTGNVVDPFLQMDKYGVDAMRYFLLKEGVLHQDGGQLWCTRCNLTNMCFNTVQTILRKEWCLY